MSHLPLLNELKEISKEEKQQFLDEGHILIENVLAEEEIVLYREAIVNAVAKYKTEVRNLAERDTYGKAFLQIMNLWQSDENVRKFVLAKRFAKIAADLLEVENVRIYHDQALFKEPGGGPTPWHQDQYYWPVDTTKTVTMWMPLVDIDIDMGMLTFASQSHKEGYVFDYEISDESQGEFESYVKKNNFKVSRATTMKAGNATFHYGNTIHNAPGNQSEKMREIMTVIYIADGAKVVEPKHKWQINDHKTWLLSTPIGELVNSELNPLVL